MAIYVVTFKQYPSADEQFAIFHSTSETMFSPTFDDALTAHLFARLIDRNWNRTGWHPWSDQWQAKLTSLLYHWLDEVAPTFPSSGDRPIPQAWHDRLIADELADLEPGFSIVYGMEELVEDFTNTKWEKVDFILEEFEAWMLTQPAVR